jgi:GAF domain-containing protein
MNRLLQQILTLPAIKQKDEIQYWREKSLNIVLASAALLGLWVYVNYILPFVKSQSWNPIIIYTLIFLWVICIAIFRRLAFALRIGSLLAILFIIGTVSTIQYGIVGESGVWFLGFAALAALFLGPNLGFLACLSNGLTLLVIGFLFTNQIIPTPVAADIVQTNNFFAWVNVSIDTTIIAITILLSAVILILGLEHSLHQGHSLIENLEQDIDQYRQQTLDLSRRQVQLRTAAEISNAISSELDPNILFQRAVELIKERFELYYVGLFVLDQTGQSAELRAGTGEAGQEMLAAGHRLSVGGSSMIGWSTSHRQSRIALDVGQDAVHFDNPHLPHTRSELALPMVSGDQVLGALSVQSAEPEAFDQDDIIVLQSIADSLGIALENATLFQQTQANLDEIRKLHSQYLVQSWRDVAVHPELLSYTFVNPESTSRLEDDQRSDNGKSTIDFPLMLREQIIGHLTLEADEEWSQDEKTVIEAVTNQAALALENVRLLEETQRNAERDRTLASLTGRIWAATDIDTVLRTAIQELGQTLGAMEGIIHLEVLE